MTIATKVDQFWNEKLRKRHRVIRIERQTTYINTERQRDRRMGRQTYINTERQKDKKTDNIHKYRETEDRKTDDIHKYRETEGLKDRHTLIQRDRKKKDRKTDDLHKYRETERERGRKNVLFGFKVQ